MTDINKAVLRGRAAANAEWKDLGVSKGRALEAGNFTKVCRRRSPNKP